MNIVFPDIHLNLTKNMARAFKALGHTLILPSSEYNVTHRPPWQEWVFNQSHTPESVERDFPTDNVKALDKEQILDLKPEVIICTAVEPQFEILNELYPKLRTSGTKLAFLSGNDYREDLYPWFLIRNYISADQTGNHLAQKHQKNHLHYCPWVDYETFQYKGHSDNLELGTYICNYEQNFKQAFDFCKGLEVEAEKSGVAIKYHTSATHGEVEQHIQNSMAGIHIKPSEGYGYSILENLACGRPVFLHRQLAQGKSYLGWCLENISALYIQSPEEFKVKLQAYIQSEDYRHWLQESAAKTVRQIVDNAEQTEKLDHFLNNLV